MRPQAEPERRGAEQRPGPWGGECRGGTPSAAIRSGGVYAAGAETPGKCASGTFSVKAGRQPRMVSAKPTEGVLVNLVIRHLNSQLSTFNSFRLSALPSPWPGLCSAPRPPGSASGLIPRVNRGTRLAPLWPDPKQVPFPLGQTGITVASISAALKKKASHSGGGGGEADGRGPR